MKNPESGHFDQEYADEIAKRIAKLKLFLAEKIKVHESDLKELSPELLSIVQSNTSEYNLLAMNLLQSHLGWAKSRVFNLLLLEALNHKENIHIRSWGLPNKTFSMFFGDLELFFDMYAYDEGTFEATDEIELDILLKKGTEEVNKLNYPANTLLGGEITEDIFTGFILENIPSFIPHLLIYI
jgi:hypothetical protein